MACRLVAIDKRPEVHPVGIGETLRRALDKLMMRAAGDQAKTTCGNLQLCAGLKAGIEGVTHAVGQQRLSRVMERRGDEEAAEESVEEEDESGGVLTRITNLSIETAGIEEEAVEGLEAELEMELEGATESEGEEDGVGTQRALVTLEFLTQDSELSGTTLVNARNGFNKLSRLAMLWTVQHRWPAEARFAFN